MSGATISSRTSSGTSSIDGTLLPGYTTTRCDLEDRFRLAVCEAFDATPSQRSAVAVIHSKAGFGDYQCNAALVLARAVNQPPPEVARQISDRIRTEGIIADITITGIMSCACPQLQIIDIGDFLTGGGFINIRYSQT